MIGISFDASDFIDSLLFIYSYNASLVCSALIAQGLVTGLLGGLLLYRRRALLSDALSHASLPGVGLGFLFAYFFLGYERNEWVILTGALLTILLCAALLRWVQRWMPYDAALALMLSGFYGLGIVLVSYIQTIPSGAKAGLETFILGQSATINTSELQLIVAGALVVMALYTMLYKEFKLLCFDPGYANSKGYKVSRFDLLLTMLTAIVIAIGIKSMGVILIIGLMTIPALTASLLVSSWNRFILCSAAIGALSCHIGAALSASVGGIPTGSAVILVCMFFYLLALLRESFSPSRAQA